MKVGDYVRTNGEIGKIINCPEQLKESYGKLLWIETSEEQRPINKEEIIKSSPNILELLEPQDLLYVDIDNDFEGGIIVPRIPETLNELNDYIKKIKSGGLILKGVITHEQLMERMFEVNK